MTKLSERAPLVRRFARNTVGRDLIIGDIHGCFTLAGAALAAIGFSKAAGDRLFSVGDLVDRGPESLEALNFLTYADGVVAGNHEDMAVRWPTDSMEVDNYRANGGAWMIALDRATQLEVAASLGALPIAIEIETAHGLVGVVHAECPFADWANFTDMLNSPNHRHHDAVIDAAQWSRNRINDLNTSIVAGVRAVVVGHTPMKAMSSLGNTIFIDTMGWRGGHFTILDAETLEPARVVVRTVEVAA